MHRRSGTRLSARLPFAAVLFAVAVAAGLALSGQPVRAAQPAPPELVADAWINATAAPTLRGQVSLVEFWTFACWNCRNVEPHVREWHETYGPKGLRVIGIHTPELAHEREIENVREYVRKNQIVWPVAIDGGYTIWDAFGVRAWPTWFLIDREGRIRYSHVGEGGYKETSRKIEDLLAER